MTAFPNTLYNRAASMISGAQKSINAAHQRLNLLGSQLSQTNTNVSALQPGDWDAITLLNSWANITGFVSAQVRVLTASTVQIIGNIQNGTTTDGTQIGQLNTGFYNPVNAHGFVAISNVDGTTGTVILSVSGALAIYGFSSSGATNIAFSEVLPLQA